MRESASSLSTASDSVRGWTECRQALSGPDLVSDPYLAGRAPQRGNNLLLMDGDLHRTLRRLLTPYLMYPRLARVEAELAQASASLVRALPGKPDVDLVADLAEPLVLLGIMSTMEVPAARRQKLVALTRGMLGLLEPDLPPAARRRAASSALRATLVFEHDAAAGDAAGLHAALEAAARDLLIPAKLARSTPVVMLHGGYENPLNQLGCLIAWAVAHPAEFRQAAAVDPDLLFDEITRTSCPVRLVARFARADSSSAGPPRKRGDLVWVDLESANHDERQFPAAAEPDLSQRHRHLGFGYGQHVCPGRTLARLEGRVLIKTLLGLPAGFLNEFSAEFCTEWREGIVARGPIKIVRR